MKVIKPPYRYESKSGLPIQFTETCKDDKHKDQIIFEGLSDEELIDILIHRIKYINNDRNCQYLKETLFCLNDAKRNIEKSCLNKNNY